MQYRRLGKTNLKVSVVGFGGIPISKVPMRQSIEIINRAINLGINYIHSSPGYGDSALKIGRVIKHRREECVLNWKCFSLTKKDGEDCLKKGLDLLQTDRIDIVQLRMDDKHYEKAMSESGSFQAFKEAQKKGVIDHIGVTCHDPDFLVKAVSSDQFSNIVVPFNYMATKPLKTLFPLVKKMDVGITAMKPLGRGALTNISTALNFIWKYGVSSAIVGMCKISEVEENASVGHNLHSLTDQEKNEIETWKKNLLKTHKVDSAGAIIKKH
jgi:predicted aldo/keto reductase-like oxidoreductase